MACRLVSWLERDYLYLIVQAYKALASKEQMKFRVCLFTLVVAVPFPGMANAETGYIVDQLLVGLRENKNVSAKLVRVLPTGERLEILEKDGESALVRTMDGAKGWVEVAYLTTEPPAQARIPDLEKKIDELDQQLQQAREETADSNGHQTGPEPANSMLGWLFVVSVGLLFLVVGFMAGYARRAKEQAKRLAGMRI